MRMIGTIPGNAEAERFSDYLVTQKIENMVEESATGGWAVWIENDDHLDRAKAELATYLQNPSETKYAAASDSAEQIRQQQVKEKKRRRAKYIDVRTRWGQAQQWAAPVTLTLIALSIVVSIGTMLGNRMDPWGYRLSYASATQQEQEQKIKEFERKLRRRSRDVSVRDIIADPGPRQILSGQIWRIFTPILLHFGILHLLFNMFWLRDLGGMIEVQRGSWRLLALVLLAAAISNTAEYLWSGPHFGGMSGVVYALFGYLWVKQRYEPHLGLGISQETALIMMGWLIICMIGIIGSAANAAHVVGLAVGAAFAYAPVAWRQAVRSRRS